jgi:hypothetical protein
MAIITGATGSRARPRLNPMASSSRLIGDGLIHAYDLFSGRPDGALLDEQGQPIQIDDLWALKFGSDTTGGEHTLLFSAGINDEKDGLVGSINHVG